MEWNLKEFFENESEFSEFIEKTQKKAINFRKSYENSLANLNKDEFNESLKEYENISEMMAKILTYSYLSFAKDSRNGGNLAKSEQICNDIASNLLFFTIEFNALKPEISENFIKTSKNYSYYLSLVKKSKKHELSLKEEQILLKTSPLMASAFTRLFDESMVNFEFDFKTKDEKDKSQKSKKLKLETLLSKMSDESRSVRKEAAISLDKTLRKNAHLLSYILNMIRLDMRLKCELRGYEYPEDIMHESNQISKKSVDALIKVTRENFSISHKYYAKKGEILGISLQDYDRYAPLGSDEDMSFDECKEIVLKAFYEFSPEFFQIAKKAFDEAWIDLMPGEFKSGGAFSHSAIKCVHPFVLLNFTGKRRDLFTLAHELGHAIHQHLAYKQSYLNQDTPLTTAETASVFCEMLVFDYVYQKQKDNPNKAKALLAAKLEDIFATLFRQINFTTFEREIHAIKDELSPAEISEIWMRNSKEMFGGSLFLNEHYSSSWGYISHFIHAPFYCYSYAYAQLFVLALFGLYKSGKQENFTEIYKEFLSLGGSKSPKEMVMKFGLDIEKDEFWQLGIDEIKRLNDEFLKMQV